MVNKIATIALIITGIVQLCSGSAIPMWEFLSRGEKMSHLYSIFAKQVSDYCKTNTDSNIQPVAQCKRDLLTYGLEQLQSMSDHHLDIIDPYQRGANDIIWSELLKSHPTINVQSAYKPTAIILTTTTTTNSNYPKNPLFEETPTSSYAMGMENVYSLNGQQELPNAAQVVYREPQNHLLPSETTFEQQSEQNTFLTGPLVVRVRPDGSEVEEDKYKPLPRDDDRETFQIGSERLPTIEQIAEAYNQGRLRSINLNQNYRISQRH